MARRLLLAITLLLGFALAWAVLTGPSPKAVNAAAGEFSAGRAMSDVAAIAREPHPVGSAADAAVRDHLLARMAALGLAPRVQAAEAISEKTHRPVALANVIGLLPGRDPTAPAVAVMAHYDSTPRGPGAADDAAGAAAVLEIARALKAGPQPDRDVAFVITDGEEAGLLGAKAFFAGDPLARRTGFVVNMEARGSRGRAMMFETGRRNGQTVRLFARTANRPVSNSLMVMVYELMPNYTDFTEAKKRGLQGVNFAFLGGPGDYHQASDTPANLDQRSLQDIGGQALAVVRGAAHGALPKAAPDLVYSDALGVGIVAYPPWVGWVIVAASAVLIWIAAAQVRLVRGKEVLGGLILSLVLLGAAAIAAFVLTLARLGDTMTVEIAGWAISLALLSIGAWTRSLVAWLGVLGSGLIASMAVQGLAPAGAPIIAWPVLLACGAAAATALGTRRLWMTAIFGIAGVAFASTLAHLAYLSLLSPLAMIPWPWLTTMLLWPLTARAPKT